MNIADKLKTITLKKKEAYLYDFINYIDIIETNRISTLAVNTKYQLLINPSFLDSLNDDEIIGCLYHELLHIKYKHLETKKTNHYLVNIAGDIFINEELLSLNYVLPHTLTKQTYLIPDYIYTAEDIYRWLEDNLSYDEKTKLFELNESEINNFDFDNVEMPGELEEILKKFDENYKSKLIKKQKIKEEEPIKWDIELLTDIGRLIKREEIKNYRRPARYEPEGIIRANNFISINIPKINIYIDKSGSMYDIINTVTSTIINIKKKLKNYVPTYYTFDTEIKEVKEDELFSIVTYGGTEFKEIQGNADLHIIITDGELDFDYIDSKKNIITYLIKDNEIKKRLK